MPVLWLGAVLMVSGCVPEGSTRGPAQVDEVAASATWAVAEPAPTRAHPFLYFTADELPAIRERLTREPYASKWAHFLEMADYYEQGPPPRPARPGRPARPRRPDMRTRLGIVGVTSFAYAITGELKYGQRAKREVFAMFEEGPWHSDLGYNRGANLGTAEGSVAAALFYDWCHDLLDDEEKARFREFLLERGVRPYLASIYEHGDWWVGNLTSNWAGVCHGGGGLTALVLYDEPEGLRAAHLARRYVDRFLRAVSGVDGAGHEGVMYWRYGTEFGHYFATAARRFFGDDGGLYAETAEKLIGYWDVYMIAPDRIYANFNNMDERTFAPTTRDPLSSETGPSAALAALFEAQVPGGDPLLLWAADTGRSANYWRGVSPFYFLWRRPDAPPAGEKPELQDAVLFRDAGHAIVRDGPLWLAFNGGWVSDASHHNCDLGTFILVADGERFVHDPGYGRWTTAQHSTLLVKARGQYLGAQARFTHFGSAGGAAGDGGPATTGFHYLACDLSDCYLEPLERLTRHVLMVDGRYVVLLDDVVLGEPRASADAEPADVQAPASVVSQAAWADDPDEEPFLDTMYGREPDLRARELPPDGHALGSSIQWRLQTRQEIESFAQSRRALLTGEGSMHLLVVAPDDARVETSTAALPFVSVTPGEPRDQEIILVVLYSQPAQPRDSAPAPSPAARLERIAGGAILTVRSPEGLEDRILFSVNAEGAWALAEVNGVSAAAIGPPVERSIVPFRKP